MHGSTFRGAIVGARVGGFHEVPVRTIIALAWLVSVPFAEAIDITLAEVQNGVAVVQGSKAAKQTTIVWEAGSVGQTTKGGSFRR